MSTADIVVIIMGVLAIISAFVIYRLQARRPLLDARVVTAPLLKDVGLEGAPIQVTYGGESLPDPFLAELRLINAGPGEITKENFDGDHSLTCILGERASVKTIVGVEPVAWKERVSISDGNVLDFAPGLIKAGEAIAVTALCVGEADAKWNLRLAKVRTVGGRDWNSPVRRPLLVIGAWVLSVALLFWLTIGLIPQFFSYYYVPGWYLYMAAWLGHDLRGDNAVLFFALWVADLVFIWRVLVRRSTVSPGAS